MSGFLDKFRQSIVSSIYKDDLLDQNCTKVNDKIALGVLLYVVAQADGSFLPKEMSLIEKLLKDKALIKEDELCVVMSSIEKARQESIDLYQFTSEVSHDLSYSAKISIIEDLFRVGCVDKNLDDSEIEIIRKISGLFNVAHKDFIDAKIKVKKEFGLNTSGL